MKQSNEKPIPTQDSNCMNKKTAILWGCVDLLASGFEAYLHTYLNWEVIRISEKGGIAMVSQIMEAARPDVVLLERALCVDIQALAALLIQAKPGANVVVTFGLDSNVAEVYSKQQVEITEISELLKIIDRHTTSQENNYGST